MHVTARGWKEAKKPPGLKVSLEAAVCQGLVCCLHDILTRSITPMNINMIIEYNREFYSINVSSMHQHHQHASDRRIQDAAP